MIRFRQFLKENSSLPFNSFIEKTIKTNTIDAQSANEFLEVATTYKGTIYKVIFLLAAEVLKYYDAEKGLSDPKGLADVVVKKFNPNRYVFFCKSLSGVDAQIKYPGLFKISEDQIGVVFSKKATTAIDLTLYDGKDPAVAKRVEATQEVLDFEDITITRIDAIYLFNQESGWKLRPL